MERACDIDREEPGRLSGVGCDERKKRKMGGVVDQNVELAKAIDRFGDDPLAVGSDADVGCDRKNSRAGSLLDQRGGVGERRLGAAGDGETRALACEGARQY